MSLDSETEKRIEEKILRRLKKQEESRIATAIEQRMREEKANWRDDEMNRIIQEMRERFQNELTNSPFMAEMAKKGVNGEGQSEIAMQMFQQSLLASSLYNGGNPQAEDKGAAGTAGMAVAADGTRSRSASKESSWNNACMAFEALRVVVWKHSFLPRVKLVKNASTGVYNTVTEVDADESFAHIMVGDVLTSVNGRPIDESVQSEEDLNDIFAAFASPLVFKFDAADPENGRVHDYTVTWSNGPLGVTLKDDCANQKVPIVNRLTKKAGSVAVKQNIAIGDVLVAINNIDTIQLGCSLSMSILKKVQLPAKLRFRGVGGPAPGSAAKEDEAEQPQAVPSLKSDNVDLTMSMTRPSTYIVTWGEGPLGLTIIPGLNENDLPVIKKVTGTGTSPGIEKAQIGDYLESMNDVSTNGMHFEKVVSYLKSTPKPVVLRFFSSMPDETSKSIRGVAPAAAAASASNGAKEVTVQRRMPSQEQVMPPPVPPARSPPVEASVSRAMPTSAPAPPYVPAPAPVPIPVPAPQQDMYQVVWGSGPLGLTIDAIPNGVGVYIKRISSMGAAATLSEDSIGDTLIYINDMDVTRLVFHDVVAHLKNVPRPVTLHFRRTDRSGASSFMSNSSSNSSMSGAQYMHSLSSSSSHRLSDVPARGRKPSVRDENHSGVQYYNVVWQEGASLGLSLRAADATCEYPYITRVTGAGSAAHLPDTVINDPLISVDGRSVHKRDKTFDEVMSMLKTMQKPITLKFQALGMNQMPRAGSTANIHALVDNHAPTHAQPPQSHPEPPQAPSWRGGASSSKLYQSSSSGGGFQPSQSYQGPSTQPDPRLGPGGAALQQQQSSLSKSYAGPNQQHDAAANEQKFSSIQAPFLVQNKLSTGRRQKMLKGLKK